MPSCVASTCKRSIWKGSLTKTASRIPRACIMLAILTTLAPAPVQAQDATFRDRAGRTIGTSRTDANDVTTFHDRAGRVTGTARTDHNGVTTFKDVAGRTTGTIRR